MIGNISDLVPQAPECAISYSSVTLPGVIASRAGYGPDKLPNHFVNLLGQPDQPDPLRVYFSTLRSRSLAHLSLTRESGSSTVELTFNSGNFQFRDASVIRKAEPTLTYPEGSSQAPDQRIFVEVLRAIRDDLDNRRTDWVNQARRVRAAYAEALGQAAIPNAANRVGVLLEQMTGAFSDKEFIVIRETPAVIPESGNVGVALYTTLRVDEANTRILGEHARKLAPRDWGRTRYQVDNPADGNTGRLERVYEDGLAITLESVLGSPNSESSFEEYLRGEEEEAFIFRRKTRIDHRETNASLLLQIPGSFGRRLIFEDSLRISKPALPPTAVASA